MHIAIDTGISVTPSSHSVDKKYGNITNWVLLKSGDKSTFKYVIYTAEFGLK